ncbi:PspC domain-containing protein [Nonomuraea sp. NPDC005983]|uniref:PspC domain-containing protein n=1 Tax=Nonomuraea sp. NPDC005983 TaxID=3155595 RepID=UPI0033BA63AD
MTEAPPKHPAAPPDVLRRSNEGRFLMGVCAGLGRYTGLDPVVFRVGFGVLLFGSGIGLFVYIAAFLLMKEPDGRPGYIEQWTRRDFTGDTVMALLTAVLAFGLVVNLATVWLGTGTLVVGVLLAVSLLAAHANGVDLLALVRSMPERLNRRQAPQPVAPHRQDFSSFPGSPQPASPVRPSPVPRPEPAPARRPEPAAEQRPAAEPRPVPMPEPAAEQKPEPEQPVTAVNPALAPDAPPLERPAAETERPAGASEAPPYQNRREETYRDRREETPRDRGEAYGETYGEPYQEAPRYRPRPRITAEHPAYGEPFAPKGPYRPLDPRRREGYSPYDPTLYGRPTAPPVPRQKRPRSFIGAITVLLATIIGVIVVAVQARSGSGVNPTLVGGAVLVTIGAGLLVAAWWGRGAGLVATGTVVALLVALGLTVGGVPRRFGESVWHPTSAAEASRRYDVGVGDGRLDLSELQLTPGANLTFNATVSIGELTVIVPPSARVEVHASNRVGDIKVDQSLRGGVDVSFDKVLEPETRPEGKVPTIVLNLRGGVGDMEVRRAA